MTRRSAQSAWVAAAMLLFGAGTLLIGRGLGDYFEAAKATAPASGTKTGVKGDDTADATAVRWNPPSIPDGPRTLLKGSRITHLEVPRLGESLYVVEGSDEIDLKKGPGHVQGSAMPGEDGNCVIAGHRDTHFRFLRNLRPGDRIFLETTEGRFCYRVTGSRVIAPSDLGVLQPTSTAQLHLITCFPFQYVGHAPKRYLVSAVLD